MPIPSIYLNLEDDVNKIIQRVKREKAASVVLVCPRRCFLFSDSINLRLLKKQTDMLGKEVFILTMDELGQMYAREAGFKLKFLPKSPVRGGMGDIRRGQVQKQTGEPEPEPGIVASAALGLKNLIHKPEPKKSAPRPLPKIKITESVYPEVSEQKDIQEQKKRHRAYRRASLFMVAVCLLLILSLVFMVLPKATVVVYPKTDPLTRDWNIALSTAASSTDATNLILPAIPVSQTLDETNKFNSQGKQQVGNQATGTVQIYNFTGEPLTLKASTTILTLGANSYLLTQDLNNVRPTTYINAVTKEVNSGSLTPPVAVIAQQGGDSYNVPAGTRVEITNQVFGSRPQLLFAKTVDPITGGTTRYLSVVTDADLAAAQNSLADQAVQDLRNQLNGKGLVLADNAYSATNPVFIPDQSSGTETPDFNAELKVQITGLAFSMPDLQQLITDRINQTLPAGETLTIDNPQKEISYSVGNINLSSGTATLSAHFEGSAVMDVDVSDAESELVGKSLSQANDLLLSKPSIDHVTITLAPSWQKNFPLLASKIKVSVSQPQ
jgi:hypothetical protein